MKPSIHARISGSLRCRTLEIVCLVIALALDVSCSARAVTGFQWKDSSGASLDFSQASSWPAGEEGRFTSRQGSNRYIPARSLAVDAGQAVVVKISRAPAAGGAAGDSGRVKLSLGARADGSSPIASASFPLLADTVSLALPIEASSRIASLSVTSEGSGSAFEIASIEVAPAFKGIERNQAGLRVSSGFTLALGGGYRELSIRRPFASLAATGGGRGARRPGLLLEYGSAPKGSAFRLEAKLPGGGERSFTLRSHPAGARTVLDESLLPADTEILILRAPESVDVRAFYAADLPPEDYELADLGRVLLADAPASDYSIYRWDLLPSVLVFDFKDYATQDKYLKRLAFFVEKIGYRGTLAKDEEIASLHGWNAHDYRAEDLAAFFQAARDKSFPLGAEEKELERLLAGAGILRESGGKLTAGEGAMISIARESSSGLRWLFAVHESTHAIFFADPVYRNFARALWASLDSNEKWFWKAYFGWAGYDSGSDYLMGNEFQAYLLQQPVSAAEEYFSKRKTAELLEKHPELKERVDEYMAKYDASFAQRAKQLESWLYSKYGIEAGRTVFLTRR
jgi:hypothetical protein